MLFGFLVLRAIGTVKIVHSRVAPSFFVYFPVLVVFRTVLRATYGRSCETTMLMAISVRAMREHSPSIHLFANCAHFMCCRTLDARAIWYMFFSSPQLKILRKLWVPRANCLSYESEVEIFVGCTQFVKTKINHNELVCESQLEKLWIILCLERCAWFWKILNVNRKID